jgi:predicted transcriptional regulator
VAVSEDCDVALLPIKPRFVQAILDGTKKVEFRRHAFGRHISYILIYASSPIKRVVGYFRIGKITRDAPRRIWQKYENVAGITAAEFEHYYAGADTAVAIEVDDLVVLDRPVALRNLRRSLQAPQSFCYLDASILRRLGSI